MVNGESRFEKQDTEAHGLNVMIVKSLITDLGIMREKSTSV